MHEQDRLLALFRQAAFGQGAWESALASLAELSFSRVAQIAVVDQTGSLVMNIVTGASASENAAYIEAGGADPGVNLRTKAVLRADVGSVISEADFATSEMLASNKFYNDFFVPIDLPHSCMVKLFDFGSYTAGLTLLRPYKYGEYRADTKDLLKAISPVLSDLVCSELHYTKRHVRNVALIADLFASPNLAVTPDLRVVHVSHDAEQILSRTSLLRIQCGRLCAADGDVQTQLTQLVLGTASLCEAKRLSVDLKLRNHSHTELLGVRVCALPRESLGSLARATALIVLQEVTRSFNRPLIRSLDEFGVAYGWTVTESEVAASILNGFRAQAIAERRGTSVGTVRNQIKSILGKTGVESQIELVLRLKSQLDVVVTRD
ncbi:helix-turn-helix transcriptional regulator [Sphingomonas sp. LB3N6]|uniref:helix-turn-helix transcriptional regulator n=1 Tax=Sphingomonas fucosidasi TaxID=3096164 RepID=UPI002FCC750F